MIETVTFTGIDERTDIGKIVLLSERYPFVEWGILVSPNQSGKSKRFPSHDFIEHFVQSVPSSVRLSLHLCGKYVRDLLFNQKEHQWFFYDVFKYWEYFRRVQINTHGEAHKYDIQCLDFLLNWPEKEYIFQYDNVNIKPVHDAIGAGLKASALFDLSHGAGVLPKEWPHSISGIKCGYAGGLSPKNVAAEIRKIAFLTSADHTWIDMETNVRTDEWLDLVKVTEVCMIYNEWLNDMNIDS